MKTIQFTDEAFEQVTQAAIKCGFRVSRGRGSQIALFVVTAANKACSGLGVLSPSQALPTPKKSSARRAVSKPTPSH